MVEAHDSPGDSCQVVLDQDAVAPTRLAEVLVALANGDGGSLLIGLAAKSDPDSLVEKALQAALSIDPPLIIPLPQVIEEQDHRAVSIAVPPGLPHVYSFKGKYLIRDGARNRPLSPTRLRRLMIERGAASFEASVPDGASLDDIDWEKVEQYAAGLPGLATVGPQEVLLKRGCLAAGEAGRRPTCAGLLLFGRDPQRWVHSSEIVVARYAGAAMDDRFIKEEIRGTLPQQIRRAEAFVVDNLRRGVRLVDLERVEEPEYPVKAVREAIVNAVAHRDYQIRGDEIRILLFSDRIEFYSPGRLPGHITVDNLVDERFSRNEAIVQVLSDMGFIERLGYGIDRILRLMAEARLPKPRFEETAAGFRVTFLGHGASLFGFDQDARRWRQLHLNERQEKALAFLAEHDRITNRDYQELCPNVSPETIRRDLADLVDKDLILKIGDKRATYYIFK
ncbi:MAG: DeoR family transcriptional regulator [Anaerolineae bacterium]|nr:DeoR family transcriptional regulator [Anaerolineae bacterium]